MNYIFISPNFPKSYKYFVKALREKGVNVFGIGDEPFEVLDEELKQYLNEYCYVSDMNIYDWMRNTVSYLKDKYGQIDYIESNNEYWMINDAKLREEFGISNGYRVNELIEYTSKSSMKKYFESAGAKVSRYIIVSSLEESLNFAEKVGYPLFAKPNRGVGAAQTFKIKNEEELKQFHNKELNEEYILEEYIEGYIISFDGIANQNSDVVIAFNETFPTPIATVVNEDTDVFYYARSKMDELFRKLGERVVKSFAIKSRCFHIEFFVLTEDKMGLAKKGEILALEANLRSPGGNTSDMLNLVSKNGYYNMYAEMIMNQIGKVDDETDKIAISVNRKDKFNYIEDDENIYHFYGKNIVEQGSYPPLFKDAMGDKYYIAEFTNLGYALLFEKFVHNKR